MPPQKQASSMPLVPDDPPPPYDEVVEQPPIASPPLAPSYMAAAPPRTTTVTVDQCVVHLKLLAALAHLRDTVAGIPGLFGINDPDTEKLGENKIYETLARVREKRWAVYTTRAVERYAAWWSTCIPDSQPPVTLRDLEDDAYSNIVNVEKPLAWRPEMMPPLDVLMVWHAHMLNPRAFLEDCIRQGKMSFWAAGLPWDVIDGNIDNQTFKYNASDMANKGFYKTGWAWDNLEDEPDKLVECPNCQKTLRVRWTTVDIQHPITAALERGHGIADKNFRTRCDRCGLDITHDALRIYKFRVDFERLFRGRAPMPGTLYNVSGIPTSYPPFRRSPRYRRQPTFPNRLMAAIGRANIEGSVDFNTTMPQLRNYLGRMLRDEDIMRKANMDASPLFMYPGEKAAFHRLLSRYWDNSSPFAVDLVGAVIRQGTFIQKMDHIDWLHSPALQTTMAHLIKKYHTFFQIMVLNPKNLAVPTLDVDLAWHTHQLSPSQYCKYSIHQSGKHNRAQFIDHDDKIDENRLSDGFQWTSRVYTEFTKGLVYSECTCWYCEATRSTEFRNSIFQKVSSFPARAREAEEILHSRPDISSDPNKNPHISAHNAIRPVTYSQGLDQRELKVNKLRNDYEKACRRAEKRACKQVTDDNDSQADTTQYVMAWGFPIAVPLYAPYMSDPGLHADCYAATSWMGLG